MCLASTGSSMSLSFRTTSLVPPLTALADQWSWFRFLEGQFTDVHSRMTKSHKESSKNPHLATRNIRTQWFLCPDGKIWQNHLMKTHGTGSNHNLLWKFWRKISQLQLQLLSILSLVLPVARLGAFHGTNITFSKLLSGPGVALACSTCQSMSIIVKYVWICVNIVYSDMFRKSTMIINEYIVIHRILWHLIPEVTLLKLVDCSIGGLGPNWQPGSPEEAWPALRIVIDLSILSYIWLHLATIIRFQMIPVCFHWISLWNIEILHSRELSVVLNLYLEHENQMHRPYARKEHKQIIHKRACPTLVTLVLNPLWSYPDVQCPFYIGAIRCNEMECDGYSQPSSGNIHSFSTYPISILS